MMSWIFISMLGIGVLMLLISVFLFVYWRVPTLMEELSGKRSRKRKKRNDEIDAASTSGTLSGSEYYKEMMLHNASLVESSSNLQEEKITDFESDSTSGNLSDSSQLAKMIEDPYGQVWGKKIEKPQVVETETSSGYQRKDKQDDLATDMLDEGATGLMHRIVILEEQSSLG